MAKLTPLSLDEARAIGRQLGVDVVRVEPLDAGSVNSNFRVEDRTGRHYFARVYEEQGAEGAEHEIRTLRALAARGVPVAAPLSERVVEHAGKPVTLYPWVDGEILCQERVRTEHCDHVGEALAHVHLATAALGELPAGRFGVDAIEARLDFILREAPGDHGDAAREVRRRLRDHVRQRDPSLPSGLVHGDLFRDNVLWQDGSIVALIDFESASAGTFAFDVMVTIQAWCYGDRFEAPLIEALLRGYTRARRLEENEQASLVTEGAIAALRFATTRITDFSMRTPPGASPARDYRRFLARLDELEAGALDAPLAALRR